LDQGAQDIWIESVAGGPRARLTFGPFVNIYPTWSPDLTSIAFFTFAGDGPLIARQPSRGGAQQLLARAGTPNWGRLYPTSWSPDGRQLVCTAIHSVAALDVARGTFRTLAADPRAWFSSAALSPDGKWVSYLSGDPGQTGNVFVIPFQGTNGVRWQATTTGVVNQFWVNGGRELDVVDGDGRLLAIPVNVTDAAPMFDAPHVLAINFPPVQAATPDGQRFLATLWPNDHQHLMVVSNWRQH
ncbi:MAG: TolB family protein, partial [Terriglobales bacterium]